MLALHIQTITFDDLFNDARVEVYLLHLTCKWRDYSVMHLKESNVWEKELSGS